MTEQLVSVIMPAYNAQEFIAEAIDSVIGQIYTDWELLIVNDGSTDKTAEIVSNYLLQDERIKTIHQTNKKLGAARNAGLTQAKGQWIAFLDADDVWLPGKLQRQLQLAADKPEVGLIFTGGTVFYNDSEETASYGTVYGTYTAAEMYRLLYTGNYIPVLSVLVKAEHVKMVGLQDECPHLYSCEDWDYWLRFCLNNVTFYGLDEKLFRYRRHLANMSNNDSLMRCAKANVLLKNFRKEMLTEQEITGLINFTDITICHFVKTGKVREAQFLNAQMSEIFASPLRRLADVLISAFKQQSYYLLRPALKIDKLLYHSTGNV